MSEPKNPFIIFLTILAFFALTIVATIRYNGDAEQAERIDEKWRPVRSFITTQSLRLMKGSEKSVSNNNQAKIDLDLIEPQVSSQEVFRHINLFKDEEGWHFILQNKDRIILEKNW